MPTEEISIDTDTDTDNNGTTMVDRNRTNDENFNVEKANLNKISNASSNQSQATLKRAPSGETIQSPARFVVDDGRDSTTNQAATPPLRPFPALPIYKLEEILVLCESIWALVSKENNPSGKHIKINWSLVAKATRWSPSECQAIWRFIAYEWGRSDNQVSSLMIPDAIIETDSDAEDTEHIQQQLVAAGHKRFADSTNVSGSSKKSRIDDGQEKSTKRKRWGKEEDDQLLQWVSQYGEGNWTLIKKNTGTEHAISKLSQKWYALKKRRAEENLVKSAISTTPTTSTTSPTTPKPLPTASDITAESPKTVVVKAPVPKEMQQTDSSQIAKRIVSQPAKQLVSRPTVGSPMKTDLTPIQQRTPSVPVQSTTKPAAPTFTTISKPQTALESTTPKVTPTPTTSSLTRPPTQVPPSSTIKAAAVTPTATPTIQISARPSVTPAKVAPAPFKSVLSIKKAPTTPVPDVVLIPQFSRMAAVSKSISPNVIRSTNVKSLPLITTTTSSVGKTSVLQSLTVGVAHVSSPPSSSSSASTSNAP